MLVVVVSGVLPHWICGPVGLTTTLVLVSVFATVLATGMLDVPPEGAPAAADPGGQADSFGVGVLDEAVLVVVVEQAARAKAPTRHAASTILRWPGVRLTVVLSSAMTVLSLRCSANRSRRLRLA